MVEGATAVWIWREKTGSIAILSVARRLSNGRRKTRFRAKLKSPARRRMSGLAHSAHPTLQAVVGTSKLFSTCHRHIIKEHLNRRINPHWFCHHKSGRSRCEGGT